MTSKKLFVDRAIEVAASRKVVWQIITESNYTHHWASEFANGTPLTIESNWNVGDDVLWKDGDGTTIVEGEVTNCEQFVLLRFTVFAANMPHVATTSEDGITWQLIEKTPHSTMVRVRQGDFGSIEGGEKSYLQTDEIWSRILPIVNELAVEAGDSGV